ncbi:MAG TPA: capsule assembly Wzi family protein [Bacteroidota bacterium]|nr:capsule assembly Wzi family protein [Bacteroidota bacterium]
MRFLSCLLLKTIQPSVLVLVLCSSLVPHRAVSQVIYLPPTHEVYGFLSRMESRGLLEEYRDGAKPLSRKVITGHLRKLESVVDKMTSVERAHFEFFKGEFTYEWLLLAGDPQPTEVRSHIVSFDLLDGIMNIDPVLGFGYGKSGDRSARYQKIGIRTYGYAFRNVGFFFQFSDGREKGALVNVNREHTPETGTVTARAYGDVLEYNATDAQFTYQAGNFELSLEKMHNVWGSGRRGNIILSTKPPSYPQLKIRVPLTSWMDFTYLHADLNSNVLDSVRSYHAGSSSMIDFFRPVYRQKYLAAHQIEFTVARGIDISLGESMVYSDKGPQLIYLVPIMFFKSAEHYNRDTDNAQLFGSIDLNVIPNVNVSATLFIDEVSTDDLLNRDRARNQVGYSATLQLYDLPFENLETLFEYSRLNPWVYSHKYPSATFANNGYDLGHWIGQNADNLSIDLRYTPIRAIRAGALFEVYRKGGRDDVAFQYLLPSKEFLYGPLREERSIGLYGRYQFVRDGFLDVKARRYSVKDQANPLANRTNEIELVVNISYGFQ